MYGITKETQNTTSGRIPTGIHENVSFNGATFNKLSDDKPPVLQYHFTDSEGRTLSHTMWQVDVERVKTNAVNYPKEHKRDNSVFGFTKGQIITPDEAVIIAGNDFNSYNKHILNRFFNEEELIEAYKNVNSYETFAEATVKLTKSKSGYPLVRLKVVLDYQQKYSVLPKNHYSPFIELQSVTPSALRIDPQYDKLVPDSAANASDAEQFNTEDFSNTEFNTEDAVF